MSIESLESELTLFAGPFLYRTRVEEHQKIKECLWEWIQKDKQSHHYDHYNLSFPWKDKGTNDPLPTFMNHLEKLDLFSYIVFDPVSKCVDELPFDMPDLHDIHLDDIWYTCYNIGDTHHPHVHPGSTFSGCYLFHLEEDNNTVFFGNGTSNRDYQDFFHQTNYAEEGDILIFPSEMYHYTNPALKNRITISFNVHCDFCGNL